MRVTNQLNVYNSLNTIKSGDSSFYKINGQISYGKNILDSFEGATTYIDNVRLEYEHETLGQVINASKLALEMTKNTDTSMGKMVDLITEFKSLMTRAVNDTQTQTSREAIAKEMKRIKEEIVNIANTSVNGQYLFSGSLTGTKPFDQQGNYFGNNELMNIVTGAGTQASYNIPGYNLFYRPDNDFKKQITTNVSFTDNRYNLINNPDKTRYLKVEDAISSLIGLNYVRDNSKAPLDPTTDFETAPLNFPPTTLYVQGTKPDGTSFKSAVLVQPSDTIQGLLDKIGAVYGNTDTTKVVDITINESGQIQITDLKQGNNSLDFHAVAYTPQFEDKAALKQATEAYIAAGGTMEEFTNEIMQLAIPNGDITNPTSPVTINIDGVDYSISLHQTDFIRSNMTDSAGNEANGADYDNVFFETKDNKVYGNVSQIVQATGAYATNSTKLSEVANGSLNNTVLNLTVNSKGGNTYNVSVDLGNSTVSYQNAAGQTITFPIMHLDTTTSNSGVVTPTNDITYKQLNDIIGLFASDQMPTATITPTNNKVNAADYQTYKEALEASRNTVEVSLDHKGRITVTDKLSTGTNIGISLHDSQSTQFPAPPYTTTANVTGGASLSFSANNALIIDEPHVDLIRDLDSMIEAVLEGNKRADADGKDPRNTGMQGALERLDHLGEHIRKQRVSIGADAAAIEQVRDRNTLMQINVKTIQSSVIDTDLGAVITQLMQAQVTYQAALKATTTLSQLSLLNYL